MVLAQSHILLCSDFIISIGFILGIILVHATALNFNLTNINPSHQNQNIKPEGDAVISPQGIQLTPFEQNKAGRATYTEPFQLWENNSRNLTDFNTYFSFVIDSEGNLSYAQGLAFFLVPYGSNPNITGGSSLGLPINPAAVIEQSSTTPLVAVEFDTFTNSWDPTFTHVGININSVISNSTTIREWYNNITGGTENEAWINYDSSSKNLSVIFTGVENNTQVKRSTSLLVDLREYLPEWVTIGFSASTGGVRIESNYVKSWQFNSSLQTNETVPVIPGPVTPGGKRTKNNKKTMVVGLSVGASVLVAGLALFGFVLWKKIRTKEEYEFAIEMSMDNEFESGRGPKKYSHNELSRATNKFSEEQKLGEGGFGGVYKGFLRELNSYVAVKRISKGSKQGIKEYASEVKIISRLRHRNLVQLIGWCHEKRELILVYEFMQNGSLDSHLFKGKSLLTSAIRYKIVKGLASALLYLHEEWEQCVIHRDIKSSNVMLDSNFNAKLGDFGLARLGDHEKGLETTVLAGTRGYMAPEYLDTGRASKESDVYGFGIVALEIASGRKPIELKVPGSQMTMVKWVWDLYGEGKLLEAVDPKISTDFNQQEMECMMIVGLWCAHPDYNLRPSIRQAIHVLNFESPLPILPAKMPVATYFAPPVQLSTAASSVSLLYGATGVAESSQNQSSSYGPNPYSSNFTTSSAASSPAVSLLYTKTS